MNNLKLKRITAGEKAKMIQSSDQCFVLQVTNPEALTGNMFKIYDQSVSAWVGGIFESEDFIVEDHSKHVDIYPLLEPGLMVRGPHGPYIATVQCGEGAYSLKPRTGKGISWADYRDGEAVEYFAEQVLLALYDPKELGPSPNVWPNYTNLDATNDAWVFLSGVPYNYMSELPMSQQFYPFEKRYLYGASIKGKNQYDYDWNVSAEANQLLDLSGNEISSASGQIKNTREYINLGKGNEQVWLAYKGAISLSGEDRCLSLDNDDKGPPILDVYEYDRSTLPIYSYEQIERVKGLKVFEGSPIGNHKSNIFSIRILDSGLNNGIIDEEQRRLVQNGINNVIREKIKDLAPAHTQLWKIIWEGN